MAPALPALAAGAILRRLPLGLPLLLFTTIDFGPVLAHTGLMATRWARLDDDAVKVSRPDSDRRAREIRKETAALRISCKLLRTVL